jgi:hypothetical protein
VTSSTIIADLDCPDCGQTTAHTSIETPLGPIDHPLVLRVGVSAEGLDWPTVRTNYLVLREPAAGQPIRVIESWWCDSCGEARWVELTLADDTLTGVRDVPLNRATVGDAHAITDEVAAEYYAATGQPLVDPRGATTGLRERLLAALPD